jgi:hypothetical protein
MGSGAGAEPWIVFETTDGKPADAAADNRLARRRNLGRGLLDGVPVLDLTRVVAGPSGTRLLGALGTDVLRIDPPHLPELRHQHIDTGFAKRSAVADLREPAVMARVRELAAEPDVVFLGYRSGAFARYGLDPATLRTEHSHLAVVSVGAWGEDAPWAGRRGFDSIVRAACGIAHLYGGERGGSSPSTTAPPALPVPHHEVTSVYGDLSFVPPPLLMDGIQLQYPYPPQKYGTATLEWTTRIMLK